MIAVLGLALLGTAVLYGRTLSFGFDWDDYHFVRPYTIGDVAASFAGPWDPHGIEAPFYRPLTVAWFAVRDRLMGTHAPGLHALSLALFVSVVVLFAFWLHTLEISVPALLIGTAAFVAHPMTAPAVAWITNQMHLLQLLLMLAALGLATRVRWGWLIPLQGAALLVKEDSLMLAFSIAGTLWARRRQVPRGWIVASAVLCATYLFVRTLALGGVGGYEPDTTDMLRNLGRAPYSALLVFPFNGGLQTAFAILILLGAAWRTARAERRLVLLMAGLFALADAPLALSSGSTRWHLIALAIAGGIAVSVHALRVTRWALPVAGLVVVGLAAGGWSAANDWRPCSAAVRAHDARVETWGAAVVPALRDKLAAKASTCGAR